MESDQIASVPTGTPDGGGAGPGGIPRRYLMFGAAGLALAGVLIYIRSRNGGGGAATTAAQAGDPNGLTPEALVIGSLESRLKETAGRYESQLADLGTGLREYIDTRAADVNSYTDSANAATRGLIDQRAGEITRGVGDYLDSISGRIDAVNANVDQRAGELTQGLGGYLEATRGASYSDQLTNLHDVGDGSGVAFFTPTEP